MPIDSATLEAQLKKELGVTFDQIFKDGRLVGVRTDGKKLYVTTKGERGYEEYQIGAGQLKGEVSIRRHFDDYSEFGYSHFYIKDEQGRLISTDELPVSSEFLKIIS